MLMATQLCVYVIPLSTSTCHSNLFKQIQSKKFPHCFPQKKKKKYNEIAQKLVKGKCNDDYEQIREYEIKFMEWSFFLFATDCFY